MKETTSNKKYIDKFSNLKVFYDKRENPNSKELKKQEERAGKIGTWNLITEIYNTPILVKTFIQKPDGSISNISVVINIKIMDEETSFFGSSKDIYLGEFDDYIKYGFGRKYIHVIKHNDNDILIYPSPITMFGGKKNMTKRNKRKKTKTKKRYL